MTDEHRLTEPEIDELVSHVLALRKDFVQRLFRVAQIPYSGLRKADLRGRLREAISEGALTAQQVARFLDEVEPGGKQHVFLVRPPRALNDEWRDADATTRRLRQHANVAELLDASIPLVMPADLQLSRVRVDDGEVEIVGVEARKYFERDESYDQTTTSEEGLPVELRAHVERVARSTVVLRWNTQTRHAALHITQASGRGLERNHYRNVAGRFGAAVAPWLDFSQFQGVNLRKVIHELYRREEAGQGVLTTSRRGRWETADGAELEAVSASATASFLSDVRLKAAVGQVADPASGQSGNIFWLPHGDGNPLTDRLHLTIIAFDSRVHFMVPSSRESVDYVLEQIRSLL